jgi:hypothetical protein
LLTKNASRTGGGRRKKIETHAGWLEEKCNSYLLDSLFKQVTNTFEFLSAVTLNKFTNVGDPDGQHVRIREEGNTLTAKSNKQQRAECITGQKSREQVRARGVRARCKVEGNGAGRRIR